MQVGAEEEAGKCGVDLLVQGTNKETDITQQVNIVSFHDPQGGCTRDCSRQFDRHGSGTHAAKAREFTW